MTLPKLTEPHRKPPPFTSPPQQPTQYNLLFTNTMSTYIPRLQTRTYACKLCSTDISSGSHPCSIWAHQMEIQHMALCHDAPLCHILPTFSQMHTQNSHFPHSPTTTKLAFTLEWAAVDAGGRGRDGVWGGNHTGRSKEGSAEDKQRAFDIKLSKAQSLKPFNTICAPTLSQSLLVWPQHLLPKEWGGIGGRVKNLEGSVPPLPLLFSLISPLPFCHFDGSACSTPHPNEPPPPPHPHLALNWQVC